MEEPDSPMLNLLHDKFKNECLRFVANELDDQISNLAINEYCYESLMGQINKLEKWKEENIEINNKKEEIKEKLIETLNLVIKLKRSIRLLAKEKTTNSKAMFHELERKKLIDGIINDYV